MYTLFCEILWKKAKDTIRTLNIKLWNLYDNAMVKRTDTITQITTQTKHKKYEPHSKPGVISGTTEG